MVVPFPPGGPSDVVARIVAEGMGRVLKQTVIIENVGGAGGTIGRSRKCAGAGCAATSVNRPSSLLLPAHAFMLLLDRKNTQHADKRSIADAGALEPHPGGC